MKRVILIFIFAGFLTACGGGGGNTPSVQMPDPSVQMPDNPTVSISPDELE